MISSEQPKEIDPIYHIRESELKYILSHDMEGDNSGIELVIRSRTHEELEYFQHNSKISSEICICDDACKRKHCGMKVPCCEEIP